MAMQACPLPSPERAPASGTLTEPERQIPIIGPFDVLVAGGGSAGLSAALAAARTGARTLLVERYGYLGGMATGGLVILLDHWDDFEKKQTVIGGIAREIVDRLVELGGAVVPRQEDTHRNDNAAWDRWGRYGWAGTHVRRRPPSAVPFGATIDPEKFKLVANRMLGEAGVSLLCHSLIVGAVVDDGKVCGVLIEGKGGRQAALGQVVIDCTGDGDVFASAGAAYVVGSLYVTLPHQIANVDTARFLDWEIICPDEHEEMQRRARERLHTRGNYWWLRTPFEGVVWVNAPTFNNVDILDAAALTTIEVQAREVIYDWWQWARGHVPGFEHSYVIDTASQLGVRQSRLLAGEYVLTRSDVDAGTAFPDTIGRSKHWYLPYRSLLPRQMDGLLVAGRCYSATPQAQAVSREIPTCMVLGEAAGVAAGLAVRQGLEPREVDPAELRVELRRRNVILEEGGT